MQQDAAVNALTDRSATLLDMFMLGLSLSPVITGIFVVLAFAALFLVFYILLSTRKCVMVPQSLFLLILRDISLGDVGAAQDRSAADSSLLARVVLPGLKLHDHPIERVQQAMEGAGRRVIGVLRQQAAYLAHIGVIAPMLGLLGTVLGLMRAFNVMGEEVREGSKAIMMNSAIGQAMTTTAIGLMVGIPAMGLYYLCLSRVGRISDDLEIAAEEVTAALGQIK